MQSLDVISLEATQDACCAPSEGGLIPRETAERRAEVFKALADPVRVQLLSHLAAACCSTVCACHLPELVGLSQPTLSHHLTKLTQAGLISKEMRGRWAHFTICPDAFADVKALLQTLSG